MLEGHCFHNVHIENFSSLQVIKQELDAAVSKQTTHTHTQIRSPPYVLEGHCSHNIDIDNFQACK